MNAVQLLDDNLYGIHSSGLSQLDRYRGAAGDKRKRLSGTIAG
jgi:hypothetical protein